MADDTSVPVGPDVNPDHAPRATEPQTETSSRRSANDGVGCPATAQPIDRLRQLRGVTVGRIAKATRLTGDVATRRAVLTSVDSRLDAIQAMLEDAGRELSAVATEVLRAHLPEGACGEPWAACTHCLGHEMVWSSTTSWCPSCGRPGMQADAADAYLCADPATVILRDTSGIERATCLSHAAHAFEHLHGLTLVQAEDLEVQALVSVLHVPLRIDTFAGQTRRSPTPPGRSG